MLMDLILISYSKTNLDSFSNSNELAKTTSIATILLLFKHLIPTYLLQIKLKMLIIIKFQHLTKTTNLLPYN